MASKTFGTLAILAMFLPFGTAAGQQPPGVRALPPGVTMRGGQPARDAGRDEKPNTFQFKGGTVAEYVDLLRKLAGLNIVIDEEVAQAEMPALELKDVGGYSALKLITMLAKTSSERQVNINVVDPEGAEASPVYVLKVEPVPQPPPSFRPGGPGMPAMPGIGGGAPPTGPRLEVFSLNEWVAVAGATEEALKKRTDTALTAIQQGLTQLAEGAPMPAATVRFHEESGLLFVKGLPAQIEVVREVLEKLVGSRARETQKESNKALETKLQQAMVEITALRAQIEDLRKTGAGAREPSKP